ncbi:L-2-amino-thiazoline-4-carboxylic acid hydrolase [Oceanirhabdus sp. W0125-5]|uniref:L-2-amino-thiazoline-4-carboxylic acid hydrolase n=1 Tax=Oceanirhabdus sp. W0125-5 TaxID=2999116 RepID=UPI0022F335D3|nr:L-2-amino-thiazoline-4-carboxylic acid hydrolase [Oceanirhabdus sp. W0125-5]WBW96058.1 L-2-amino-thiazoline-4-carboxylic acid hydrolase [Oceanirhabdus sp. W0125-5]
MRFIKIIYNLTMIRSKKFLIKKYDKEFWNSFKSISKKNLDEILPKIVDIGDSIFSFNYKFGPCYVAWFKAFSELGINVEERNNNIWSMNEKMVTTIPKPFLRITGKSYLNGFRKKAEEHVKRQNAGELHPYDWKVRYREISSNTFELDITECALKRMANDFGALELLPSICRMDYLFSSLMGNGFERTKTLGDGDDCCNCRYHIIGNCEWSPEKGFIDRK